MSEVQSMQDLMRQIQEITMKQKSQNKGDEVAVAQTLLNDPDFQVGIYDKNKGLIGTRNVHEEAVRGDYDSLLQVSLRYLDMLNLKERVHK